MNAELEPNYYVGIGASAGGLEALQAFFEELPVDTGACYIVVQHLSPDFKSVMVELLSKCTEMKVVQATDSTAVEANTIYLIPPAKNMMIGEGKLLLSDQLPDRKTTFPIDVFFRSLAEDRQRHAIAVVLSGTGSDGSRGISAVKEAGGLVLVQKPESAKFDGMPRNAIYTHNVDFVGQPEQLADKIAHFVTHAVENNPETSLLDESFNKNIESIYKLLEREMDVDFSRYKDQTIRRRIYRRMSICQAHTLTEYLELLHSDSEELQSLSREMLIGVTRFFRDDDAFIYLEQNVIPEIIENVDDKGTLRIWSAGCSTGEEPISLAILADEYIRRTGKDVDVKIFASDVDPDAIEAASNARFSLNIIQDLGQERFEKYFEIEGDECVLIPRIRKMIIFTVHNIISDPPFSNINLAVCRNMLIYFQNETQARVLSMLQFSLKMQGLMFLGASESHIPIADTMETLSDRYKIFRKIESPPSIIRNDINVLARIDRKLPSVEKILRGYERDNVGVYKKLIENILEDHMPPSFLISSDKKVLHYYGGVEQFTKNPNTGKPSNNISDILVEALTIPVSTAIQKVRSAKEDRVQYERVPVVTSRNENLLCDVIVNRYQNINLGPIYYLIVVKPHSDRSTPIIDITADENITYDIDSISAQRITDLEKELDGTQERLKITVEELETTNEELQSSNEELLASNEELQSTNEELQSVNEELYTINSEYQQKITEITEINSDFDSLVNSIQIGILFLDCDLIIRRFSPAMARHINLLQSDVGRPVHHIAHNLVMPSFLDMVSKVISDGRPYKEEIATTYGGWVQIQINPAPVNTEVENQTGRTGCVITITDMSDIKSIRGRLKLAYTHLRRSIATHAAASEEILRVLILDDDEDDIKIIQHAINDIEDFRITTQGVSDVQSMPDHLASNDFDICLFDLNLGSKTAFDVLESMKSEDLNLPIILISGALSGANISKAAEFGVYETLEKSELSSTVLKHTFHYILQLNSLEKVLTNRVVDQTAEHA